MTVEEDEPLSKLDTLASLLYLATMTLMGAFIVSIAEEISDLAVNVNSKATDLGTVFIAHGVGSVSGSLLGSPFYRKFNGDIIVGSCLVIIAAICFGLPAVTTVINLHIVYFIAGLAVGLCDTGANILISKLLGKRVGPWMIALQLGFNLGGFLGIIIAQVFSLGLLERFYGVGVLLGGWGIIGLILPPLRMYSEEGKHFSIKSKKNDRTHVIVVSSTNKTLSNSPRKYSGAQVVPFDDSIPAANHEEEEDKDLEMVLTQKSQPNESNTDNQDKELYSKDKHEEKSQDKNAEDSKGLSGELAPSETKKVATNLAIVPDNYRAEICLGLAILFNVGSGTAATAFLHPYAEKTGLVSVDTASLQVSMIWLAMTAGLTFSLFLRKYVYPKTEDIPYLFAIFSLIAAVGALLMIIIPEKQNHSSILWLGLMLFGFFSKPCVGFAFQWIGIVTYATETSFAIAYVGLNSGSGIIPYITTAMWNYVDGPTALFIVLFVSMILTIPLFLGSRYVSCKKQSNQQQESH